MRSRGWFFAGTVGVLAVVAATSVSAAIGTIEEFEDETADSTTFSESGGPDFTVNGDLKVEFFTGLGSTPPDSPDTGTPSDFWLGTGFLDGSSALGSVGTISVPTGWTFVVNGFDAWTGREDGSFHQAGRVTFRGTKADNSTVDAVIDINTNDDFLFIQDLSFSGTALDGVPLTSLEVFLTAELAPDAGSGSFDYLALDNIDFTTSFDDEDPVLTVPADISQSTDAGLATAAVSFTVTATDNVAGVTVSCDAASGDSFPVGTTTVNCTATDVAGNTDSDSFDITVTDDEDPVLTVPADITTAATSLSGAQVSFTVTATDNVDPVSPTCSPASGSVFPLGTTAVTCTATDVAGNTSTASFDVTVEVGDGAVQDLIDAVTDLGLPNGVTNSLLSTLKNVDKLFDDANPDNDGAACDKLTSFVGKVAEQEAAGTVTAPEASQLTAFAQAIAAANGCVTP